ncbi:MAG: dihydropteroate synthase [Gammaproteobacteria bacterium]|jgi:dihydropteroate synthase|nr:dihydropteroate synthase [Gammaproteobacteria bacterium]MBT4462688.1 dihydropteroate synthase [Gammaproteobacteria bacterium]MBT4654714.1 dihydropteroate synthase [Gammaproteobacteria bacterium]MBT5117400.1 dihydropteroate synthase [Gammaproteobacteria bacterium]MBT5762210.1 dihydropteroate synthase [Gammaproteobacteria bacterium]
MKNKTKIIGILNITDDSFSDGGKYLKISEASKYIKKMISDNCHIIDIGAESSKPGFIEVPIDKQISRILPIISEIKKISDDITISIDTRSSKVAESALKEGANIINDVSSGNNDKNMFDVVAKYNADIILTHMPDEHLTSDNIKCDDILENVEDYFREQINQAVKSGISQNNIIIDPGICFGKSGNDNIKLLSNMKYLVSVFDRVCIGVSNKRFSSKIFKGIKDSEMKIAALTISTLATCSGVEFLRVHDTDANHDAVEVAWKTINS